MVKCFTFDMTHMQRNNLGFMDCDAKVCCNRIIPLVLLLAYFKAGLPYECAAFLITILYNLKYILTTALGQAPQQNCHNVIAALYGIGQGSMDRPPGWLFISNILLKCYSRLAKGYTLQDSFHTNLSR
eukprot:4212256-Ditylum_brightwellii.AAC.1